MKRHSTLTHPLRLVAAISIMASALVVGGTSVSAERSVDAEAKSTERSVTADVDERDLIETMSKTTDAVAGTEMASPKNSAACPPSFFHITFLGGPQYFNSTGMMRALWTTAGVVGDSMKLGLWNAVDGSPGSISVNPQLGRADVDILTSDIDANPTGYALKPSFSVGIYVVYAVVDRQVGSSIESCTYGAYMNVLPPPMDVEPLAEEVTYSTFNDFRSTRFEEGDKQVIRYTQRFPLSIDHRYPMHVYSRQFCSSWFGCTGSSAQLGQDYTGLEATPRWDNTFEYFPAHSTQHDRVVHVIDDNCPEPNETIFMGWGYEADNAVWGTNFSGLLGNPTLTINISANDGWDPSELPQQACEVFGPDIGAGEVDVVIWP